MLSALSTVGEVDLFVLGPHDGSTPAPADLDTLDTLDKVVTSPTVLRSPRERTAEWMRSDRPRRMLDFDWSEARRELAAWGPEPDVVWYSLLDTWHAVGDLFPHAGSIVDFDNLENLGMRLRRRQPPRFPPGSTPVEKVREVARWVGSRSTDLIDERRWDAMQRRCSGQVEHVVVCSTLDVGRRCCSSDCSTTSRTPVRSTGSYARCSR
jgi:hypothetical protein